MAALVLAQHDNRTLDPATLHAVTAARQITDDVDLLVAGHEARPVAEAAAKIPGVRRVLLAQHPAYANPVAEDLAPLLVRLMADYDFTVLPVVDARGELVGILTDRDIRLATSNLRENPLPCDAKVYEVMTRPVLTADPLDPVEDAWLQPDGIHLTAEGHARVADVVINQITSDE